MYRKKDFILMEVADIHGKKLGYINDLLIDCKACEVKGFIITPSKIFSKQLKILKEDIICFDKRMIISKVSDSDFLPFHKIVKMDVVDKNNKILGIVEDLIFSESVFKIEALIISSGVINSFLEGKKIVLLKDIIVGDRNLLCCSKTNSFMLTSLPHKLFMEVDDYEKK